MSHLTKYVNFIKYSHYLAMLATALLIFVCAPGLKKLEDTKTSNMVSVFINGTQVGTVKDASEVAGMITEARRRIASDSKNLVLVECEVVLSGSTDVVGQVDDREVIVNNIYELFRENVMRTKQPAYEVKINDFTVNLRSLDDVIALLDASKSEYDPDSEWKVWLEPDNTRELNVMTTRIEKVTPQKEEEEETQKVFPTGGALLRMEELYDAAYSQNLEDSYEFGVNRIAFDENVEVVQAYVDGNKISSLEEAIEAVTKTSEKSKKYEVVAGDTLGGIAQKNDMTIDEIIELNPVNIPNENATIRVGDEITISSPEPELSVVRTERRYYEENYDEDVVYVDNDDWYTNESVVLQQPVTGYRKVVADVTYRNAQLQSTDILYQNVTVKAVAKIVERGTKVPPNYVYPLWGRLSSGFGRRKAPKRGASTFHKGIDIAVPIGTAVMASCGGTVSRAGWGSGYGYVVYIDHPDGKSTRYGHLSKVLVKAGQKVSQGQKIALSGNTGVSTGPHLHFEILVGGAQVNPLKYLH
ncbi:MAG: M23 family metallopeptidase [Lachnospiraceae bacterium]|nr:M23 family metallopeptidase [Lachnospiraceae bacterium]